MKIHGTHYSIVSIVPFYAPHAAWRFRAPGSATCGGETHVGPLVGRLAAGEVWPRGRFLK